MSRINRKPKFNPFNPEQGTLPLPAEFLIPSWSQSKAEESLMNTLAWARWSRSNDDPPEFTNAEYPGWVLMPQFELYSLLGMWHRFDLAVLREEARTSGGWGFAMPMLMIEVDGAEGHSSPSMREQDYRLGRALEAKGVSLLRFTGAEVLDHERFFKVVQIHEWLRGHSGRQGRWRSPSDPN